MKQNYSKRQDHLVHSKGSVWRCRGSKWIFFRSLVLVFFIGISSAYAQKTVTGTVTEAETGEVLPGVTVMVKGTGSGTITDGDGAFSISANSEDILVFSFVGFRPVEVTLGSRTNLQVSLSEDITELTEVVVTALGIEKEEKSLGYSVATVESKDITSAGNMNVGTGMIGKMPGVRVNASNGGAASAVNIQVRGTSSISGNTQPLYVVDGVPMRRDALINMQAAGSNDDFWSEQRVRENGLIDINPEDIASISVLKGASATALYGSDGTNGVVVITTKKGTSRKKGLGVDLKLQYDVEQLAFQPDWQNSYGPGYDGDNNKAITGNRSGWVTESDGSIHPYYGSYGQFGPRFDGREVSYWDGTTRKYSANEDNYKDFFNTGYNKNANIAISNAGDQGSFRVSYARQDYEGIMPGFDMKKE
ncbi:TonB-dependent receptor plug domain-containing protein [Fulvivirga maritima]|uniref:carboxypeptidase-like regulatory domain-containing protein n=1 Tax=Fulvivirga maritima TaxID=2904247 RepID=UPI001F400C0A|nr:carboxypeptidase-like regulatory domain-containing protein [Fulvivirga maritima]UII25424.1 TonB-dependent receptor plug domain-containing protein [Fulvivirga maritima]